MNDQPKTAVTRIAASVHSVLAEQPGMNASDVFLDQDFDPDLFLRAENFAPVLPCAQYPDLAAHQMARILCDDCVDLP
jgi:hypothetical protein